ncbi:MAG: POTRA domain-containing protein [Alphaproteobacteria bacterium]|nr:POTRA domain-containing protein [Alphaproteobacteria bacterium]MDP6819202.1 POTRA domain-containing protein [Alphaproteobacteria bacterium]
MKIFLGLMALSLVAALLTGQAGAQEQTGVTEQQRLLDRFDDSQLPKSTFDKDDRADGMTMTRSEAEQHRFTLKRLGFSGMTIYGADDMRPFFADMLGTEISLAEILDVAKLVERKYDQDGYTSADVLLRAMPTDDGKVTLIVSEKY